MSNLPTFGAYAAAFEESLQDGDWTRLEQYFYMTRLICLATERKQLVVMLLFERYKTASEL